MATVDRTRQLTSLVIPADAVAGTAFPTDAQNNVRTERFQARISAPVDITVAGTGLRNRGSILGALGRMKFIDNGVEKFVADLRLARYLAECMAPSPLPAVRLADADVQTVTLEETVPLWLASPRTIDPNDTKYVEVNKQGKLSFVIEAGRGLAGIAEGVALAGTVGPYTITIEQIYDEMLAIPPLLQTYFRQVEENVSGANSALKIDLKGDRYIRLLIIQQDSNESEVDDLINGVVLRGDRRSIIGDDAVSFADLVQHAQEEFGGAVTQAEGYLIIDLCRYGRLATQFNPLEDTSLRLLANCQPTVTPGRTGSKIRVGLWETQRSGSTAVVLPFQI